MPSTSAITLLKKVDVANPVNVTTSPATNVFTAWKVITDPTAAQLVIVAWALGLEVTAWKLGGAPGPTCEMRSSVYVPVAGWTLY